MIMIRSSKLLRLALAADAAACGAMGLLLAGAAKPLAPLFGLPVTLLQGAGLALLPCAAALAILAGRHAIPSLAAYAVIGINLLWIVDSLLVAFAGWFAPSTLGLGFVLAQAAAVAAVTECEFVGLKRSASVEQAA